MCIPDITQFMPGPAQVFHSRTFVIANARIFTSRILHRGSHALMH